MEMLSSVSPRRRLHINAVQNKVVPLFRRGGLRDIPATFPSGEKKKKDVSPMGLNMMSSLHGKTNES